MKCFSFAAVRLVPAGKPIAVVVAAVCKRNLHTATKQFKEPMIKACKTSIKYNVYVCECEHVLPDIL